MSLPPSHKNKTHQNMRKSQHYQKKKYTNYNKQHNTHITKPKKEVKCFKCGKKGHISPNYKKQKINVLSDDEGEYNSEASEESISSDN